MKQEFIHPHSEDVRSAPKDFNFALYLNTCLGFTIGDTVHLPLYSWLIIEVILLLVYSFAQSMERRFTPPAIKGKETNKE